MMYQIHTKKCKKLIGSISDSSTLSMGAQSWDSFLHQLLLHAWSGTSAIIKHSLLDSGDLYYCWGALLQWLRVNGLLTPNYPLSWRHSVLHIWRASEMLFHPISTLFNRFVCDNTRDHHFHILHVTEAHCKCFLTFFLKIRHILQSMISHFNPTQKSIYNTTN